ncbi:MAG TPA: RNA polymerase sigma factor SigJ [Arachnia sp.]|nr:RNA polymerase sigma factor SigJ [Arachnia sp.]HMT87783.1 RNA polymerase sigma factor SigJ [Arachnia sp.]
MTTPTDHGHSEPPELGEAISERRMLLGLSYRLLGSLADAEDAVQETYIRWYRLSDTERRQIGSPRAWLIKTAGRIGLDMLTTARARREQYVGEWLPEPVPTPGTWTSHHGGDPIDPADRISLDESVSMALLIVLESMTPAERVAFILHDVFRYTFPEVAEVVGRTPEACRQLASSARRRVLSARSTTVAPSEHATVVRAFKTAWESGDLATLVTLLDPDATAITDGGGLVSAALEPLLGADAVATFFLGVYERQPDLTIREELVNGELGLVATGAGHTLAVISLNHHGGKIGHIWAVRNPQKLEAWH